MGATDNVTPTKIDLTGAEAKRSFAQSSLPSFLSRKRGLTGEELFHPVLQTLHRQGEHRKQPLDGVVGLGPVLAPGGTAAGVEPDDVGVLPPEALEPIQSRFGGVGVSL